MSLTSFVEIKDVREKFNETFSKPKIGANVALQFASQTKNYGLVGQGFDYLLRFYLQRIHPFATSTGWLAEAAIIVSKVPLTLKQEVFAQGIVKRAKAAFNQYQNDGNVNIELAKSALCLAQLDLLFRPGILVPNLGTPEDADVDDLIKLMSLVTPDLFQAREVCVLNPTFGVASRLVGGADMDVVLDDMLVEIKTTKGKILERGHFNQLLGYYVLSRIAPIDGAPPKHKINRLGIYSARYRQFYTINLKDIASESVFLNFTTWFEQRAKEGRSQVSDSSIPLVQSEQDSARPPTR